MCVTDRKSQGRPPVELALYEANSEEDLDEFL
jgi:hypothetical protein